MGVIAGLKGLESFPNHRELALRLEGQYLADPRIAGVVLRGSVGRGENDRFSDLDFTVAVEDAAYDEVLGEREAFYRKAGNLGYWFISAGMHPRIFVGFYEGLVEVNAVYLRLTEVEPAPSDGGWVIVKDTTGWLSEVEAEQRRMPIPRPAPVLNAEDKFWLWAFRTAARVERGELWHAWDMLNDIRKLLMDLLVVDAGRPCFGFRQFPRLLSRADERWLAATVCPLEEAAILNALSAAVGLYTTLRARRQEQPANPRLEAQVKRMLQETVPHHHHHHHHA